MHFSPDVEMGLYRTGMFNDPAEALPIGPVIGRAFLPSFADAGQSPLARIPIGST
jgi:hypothetical protein